MTTRRIYVRLAQSDIEHISRLAKQNRRHPADEAALLLERAIKLAAAKQQAAEVQHASS